MNNIEQLLAEKKAIDSEINQLPYRGYPEVKEISGKKYIYIRHRSLGRGENEYVGTFDESLYESLEKNYKHFLELIKKKRKVESQLASLGVSFGELKPKVVLNIGFAIGNIKNIIYDQAVLEGIATTYPQTEQIINNESVSNMIPSDIQKILNLKHAWEFILDKDIIVYPSDLRILKTINKVVEEGLVPTNGIVRSSLPVRITGTNYIPPMPTEEGIKEKIKSVLNKRETIEKKAIDLCLAVMKGHYFQDGNKRTAVIFANHFLVSKGKGILVVPYEKVPAFRKVLVKYYENENDCTAKDFLLKECILPMQEKKMVKSKDLEMQ